MRIGIQLDQVSSTDPARLAAFGRAVEQDGYASLWVGDRLVQGPQDEDGPTPDPFAQIGFLAAATERVRLGTSVVVAPSYPPTLLARALTTLDGLTSQRFVAGLLPS